MSTTIADPGPRPATGEVVVSIRGLTKVFKDFWGRPKARAVDNVDFDVRRGEVFGLLGPNGSGKSTTVKLILGLLHPTKGHLEVFGHSPSHVATKARIGYLPEESYLYRYLNSGETLDFFGNLFCLPRHDRHDRTEQLLEMVGLSQARLRAVGEFSKGMQRRIGLAQALINDPDLVILDEPTSGLDPIGCREVKDLILALARRGKTVLLSSHLLADVEDVCDRVVIYYGGRIQAMGSLKELLAAPDAIRLTLPALPRETLERVLAFIRQDVAESRISIDTPTQNLERYFLEVVQNARLAEAETSGAVSGARVAAYLRGEAEAAPASDKILERLAAPPPARPAPTPAPKPDETVDRQKLEALIKPSEPAAPPPPPPAAEKPSTTEELRQANEKLASLVRKQKE
ncbi:MAG TPA: ABC transporter ATP-binding protein [Verrucomicrobiota bacterium]|jgi:ABC-2 type transport system ATP-binding protein|nr:ABC transporter ATP-binding protein [Verrucomicrobiota bacterium]HCL91939.1 ABC transporter ATP-binding protein [Limisphaerales bacterium]HRR63195.1 ABC transporter ATP-binding protein [Candidatus Paceibacterota bacterium]NLH85191.1 ABC transporter ATP-binding protein [Verrucomicrobiota bacterium]HNR70309.1 ABC transporter ATP-binding protein [Verrucomicrobiota bacterium]